MDSLLIIQTVSMTLTLCIGLMLALSRLHMTTIVHRYEVSRWMLVAAMFIYSIHYLLQIVFGFRASGDDVGAVVNILFYTPVVYLISFSIVRMTSNKTYTRKYMFFSIISYTTILAIFIAGLSVKKSLHFGFLLHIMGGIFFASIIFAVVDILKEGKSLRRDIESDTAGDLSMFNNYMLTGTFFLLIFSPLMPIVIFSRVLLMIVGPLFLVLLFVLRSTLCAWDSTCTHLPRCLIPMKSNLQLSLPMIPNLQKKNYLRPRKALSSLLLMPG